MRYSGRSVFLASMHQKEEAIAPIFERELGCKLVLGEIDTDKFGTFTGDIKREQSPYDTCLLKAKHGAKLHDYCLSVASEGSFGPHPANPFVASAEEIMVFVDLEHNWVIAERLITTKTNYQTLLVKKDTDIKAFLSAVLFPSHALTIQIPESTTSLAKGICDAEVLKAHLQLGFLTSNALLLATDMRAMMNPTRMRTLGELAARLARRILTACERCSAPGFGFVGVEGQLACEACGTQTGLYRYERCACVQCDFSLQKERADGLTVAEAMHCPNCNP